MSFPKNFTWGVAAASYQIEGAVAEDGKGPSVWDMFCRREGAIWQGQSGDPACDHYHRWQEDVALMKDLGIKAYRLSISWPRVLPDGVGKVNEKGLAFYDRLIDGLVAAGITPWVTLFHWDYPLALYQRGGWLNRDSADWFAEYAGVVVSKLSDRVKHWMTLNEPQCFIDLGHRTGYHAPGEKLPMREVLLATHHTLLAHGRGVQAIRAASKQPATVGIAPIGNAHMPENENSKADIDAARTAMFGVYPTLFSSSWWLDPIFFGKYPQDSLDFYGPDAPTPREGDMKIIFQPLDFLGLNIYNGNVMRAGPDGKPQAVPLPIGFNHTSQEYWPILPNCLYWGPKFMAERYKLPIVITENGHQNIDLVHLDGKVHDPQRIDYLARHLRQLKRAIDDGVDIRGYLQWCFTDNFEWAWGYATRVGIVYTDYPTQKRVPKDSAYWYRDVIARNGEGI